ncbi:phage tail protein [Desulfovibrio mangrovi]|uniref:phage tail protein n=1 Tax=Desulfovibrio mangrovi TaxID=2976983 RepID=UPI0022464D5D|nr:phage tail protein [Desulfovibrio mangrovi]UZP67648.1 phage tail protein [Desulfovibrio mangrovi]
MSSILRSRMINELFANGRCRSGVLSVCESIASEKNTSLQAVGLDAFARMMDREYSALSGDASEVAGLLKAAAPGSGTTAERAVQLALRSRYADGIGPAGWSLWQDDELRGVLADCIARGIAADKTETAIAEDMTDVLEDNTTQTTPPALPVPEGPTRTTEDTPKATGGNIGSFGPVAFTVSRETVHTLHDLSRKRSARFAEHAVQNAKPKLQFQGVSLWEVSFRIRLVSAFSAPAQRIAAMESVQESGKAYPLVIGGRNLGTFVLVDVDVAERTHGPKGVLMAADLSVSLKEYC